MSGASMKVMMGGPMYCSTCGIQMRFFLGKNPNVFHPKWECQYSEKSFTPNIVTLVEQVSGSGK